MTDELERRIPSSLSPYSRTGSFTAETVPAKLTKAHNTKSGVWGLLHVEAGEVRYYLEGRLEPLTILSKGERFVIRPQEDHFVQLSDDARFFVEFYK